MKKKKREKKRDGKKKKKRTAKPGLIPMGSAAGYLGNVIYKATQELLQGTMPAYRFIRDLQKYRGEYGKGFDAFLRWTTPSGLEIWNSYKAYEERKVRVFRNLTSIKYKVYDATE